MKTITEAEARKPFRSFVITSLGYEFIRFEGHGMTLEVAIERESKALKDGLDPDGDMTGVVDEVIYEGSWAVAVLRLTSAGEVVVTRINPRD